VIGLELAKAYLAEVDDPFSRVTFHFNPTTINFTKQANFRREPNQAASSAPPVQFQGTGPTDLSLSLLLDAVGEIEGSVAPEVHKLLGWTNPEKGAGDTTSPSPPKLMFNWGQLQLGDSDKFVGHLESVTVRYTLFRGDGTPLRAEVDLKLTQAPAEAKAQNPTSGGLSAQRVHRVARGDTLQSIAWAEYGDASLWRGVAAVNGIDDPMRLRPGRELRLPSGAELRSA
jgi:hypothetical protein